jgi:hypothetical protein
MSASTARLVLRGDAAKVAPLDPAQPLTIGQAEGNRLRLTSSQGVSDHHAVVRFSRSNGWVVCDWKSRDGTYLEGQRIRQCRPLADGDEIRLGPRGPVLVFQLAGAAPAAAPAAAAAATGTIAVGNRSIPLSQIRSATVRSQPIYPHIFSWWLLLCLGGLLLLPFPLLFWPLQAGALAGWILLGSRKQHSLVVVLHDGQALRHSFANRLTALSHRNGIRKAIGQADGTQPPQPRAAAQP